MSYMISRGSSETKQSRKEQFVTAFNIVRAWEVCSSKCPCFIEGFLAHFVVSNERSFSNDIEDCGKKQSMHIWDGERHLFKWADGNQGKP
jgi:hypothetical protein